MIKQAYGIAHTTAALPCDVFERHRLDLKSFFLGNVRQPLRYMCQGNATEIEALTTGDYGRRDLVWLRSGQYKNDMRRWFLQRFEQRIERWIGEHMNLINDIELDASLTWSKANLLTEVTDFINSTIAGRIDLDHIQKTTFVHSPANTALTTWFYFAFTHAVYGLGQ